MDKILIQHQADIRHFVFQINMLLDKLNQRDKIDFDQTREKVQAGETIEFWFRCKKSEHFTKSLKTFTIRQFE